MGKKKLYATMTSSEETLGPKKAKEYLGANTKNRKLRPILVERYAQDMRAGKWKSSGQPIIFDWFGNLINGQHRLAAITLAKVQMKVLVVRGVDPDAFDVLDTGAKRTLGDVLSAEDYSFHNEKAAAIRVVFALQDIEQGKASPAHIGRNRITPDMVREFADAFDADLTESIRKVKTKDARMVMSPPALFGALHFLFAQGNKVRADEFFDSLISGENMVKSDPIYPLRKQLTADRADKRSKKKNHIKAAMCIKAWNAFLRGEPMTSLRFTDAENWPQIGKRSSPGKAKAEAKTVSKKDTKGSKKKSRKHGAA